MKLLTLKITSEFRNLKGLNLNFDSANDTHVIIGNNGTGKTNILEALSCVFSVLLSHSTDFLFSFVLRYEINDIQYRVKHNKDTGVTEYQKDNIIVTDADMIYPNRIVCNYSGEDTRMWDNYYKKANEEYLESVRTAEAPNVLSMIYIDRTMWKYILLSMLATRDVNVAFDKFLQEKLGIASGNVDSIDLKFNAVKLSKWRKENQITLFIRQLRALFGESYTISSNDVTKFNPNDDDARLLFNKYMGASQVIDALDISFNGGIESAFLSEGEKKMMVILFILEAISDERTVVLMDEPDSHIHISRKSEVKDMFDHMSHRSNLITSHSPTLTTRFNPNTIIMLDRKADGKVDIIDKRNVDIVGRLTNGVWTAQRQNIFLSSHDDILLVEGSTDITFIKAALQYFHNQGKYTSLSFEYIPCGGASHMKDFASIFKPKGGQMVFGFLDGDRAGRESMHKIIKCPDVGAKEWDIRKFGKARKKGDVWFSFYPAWKGKKNADNFNVEDYFTCTLFRKYIFSFSSLDTIKNKDGLKTILEKDCKRGVINPKFYDKFNTLFDHILKIKDAENMHLNEF